MKRNTLLVTLAGTAALAAALVWAFAPRPVRVELAAAAAGRYVQTIDEDAKTRLTDRYLVSAPLTGRLARIALREGDTVAADSVVATLTPALPAMLDERTLRELQARVEAAEAALERAGARIERTRVTQAQAKAERGRSEQLAARGFIAPTKLETDRLMELAAQKEVDAAVAERHVATHDLEQAKAALGTARKPIGSAPGTGSSGSRPVGASRDADLRSDAGGTAAFTLRSPVAGQVMRVLQASEATVTLGTPLLEIGDTSRLEIVVELLTTDALSARTGSPVMIERWGGSGTLEGRVARIEPAGFTKVSALGVEEQRVRAVVELTSAPELWQRLGDGYRVGLRIVVVDEAGAMMVPVGAVFPLAEGAAPGAAAARRHAVFVHEDGRAKLTPVAVGGRNGAAAWISEGLSAGQQVVVYPPAGLRDGARVQTRAP